MGEQSPKRSTGLTYRDAGVDIDQAAGSLETISRLARLTRKQNGEGDIGHFGGVFRLPAGPDRLLVASADGIGTKIKLAFIIGGSSHEGVGSDLVNHCVNDLLACGARPLFFLDYIAMGKLDTEALEGLVEGMATACRENGLALIGGETAEMPGLYADGEYDAAGFIVGEVAPEKYIDGTAIREGDMLIGYPSTGLHTNGYSLARKVIGLTGDVEEDRRILGQPLRNSKELTLAEALLAPHRSYLQSVGPLIDAGLVHGMAHITGGGLIDNVPRMMPEGLVAVIDPATWNAPPIFEVLIEQGDIDEADRYRAFNMGIGLVLAIEPTNVDQVRASTGDARIIGQVEAAPDFGKRVRIIGVTG
ncbi:MAG: phosphoribosylformylglycinamidine cyclo-ligase [Thermomicrobiales bacterium]